MSISQKLKTIILNRSDKNHNGFQQKWMKSDFVFKISPQYLEKYPICCNFT